MKTSAKEQLRSKIRHLLNAPQLTSSKVWVVMGFLSVILILGGRSIENRYGLLLGFLTAVSLNSIVFFYGDLRLSALFPGEKIEGSDPWGALRLVKKLAREVAIPAPSLVLVESTTPLAFSAGLLPMQSTIFVSTELLQRFTREELTSVLVHELVKMKTQKTASATAASALAGVISHTASLIDDLLLLRFFRRNTKTHSTVASGPMTLIVSPLVAGMVRLSLGRRAIFEADKETIEITKDSKSFASALRKLDSYAKTRPLQINLAEAHLFTVSPLGAAPFWQFVSSQPLVELRLLQLTGHFPI